MATYLQIGKCKIINTEQIVSVQRRDGLAAQTLITLIDDACCKVGGDTGDRVWEWFLQRADRDA